MTIDTSKPYGGITTVTFSNGQIVPSVAYGTGTKWFAGIKGNDKTLEELNPDLVNSILEALRAGFRHIDTAEMYGTELEVGAALTQFFKETGLKRTDVYITTKVYYHIDDIPKALDSSLARLGPSVEGYVDLYLIHSPFWDKSKQSFEGAWKLMEECLDSGKVKAIGTSNYRVQDFEEIFKFARIKPVCNQIEYNPYLQNPSLKTFSDANGITTAAYAPLGPLTHHAQNGTLQSTADSINATRRSKGLPELTHSQLLLLWSLNQGAIAVTTTSKKERMLEFLDVQNGGASVDAGEVALVTSNTEALELRRFWAKEFAATS
ncbi:hypothetical protein HDU67_005252 [Dinochytrium kinnereticum]|nr:hypothetical protein HDU67_005252 [Dinochytrium kinnereticum]